MAVTTMDDTFELLTLITAVASGAAGGALFPFSTFAMAGLIRLPPSQGIAAMQSINVRAMTPAFMTLLFGTGLLCIVLVVRAIATWGDDSAVPLLVGGIAYLVGTIILTLVYNVPRNDRLAAVDADASDAESVWTTYVREWTAANHVRVVAGVVAAVSFTIAYAG
ncbi:anthrone oxygenase family protein [Solicola gregarius]|uniref:DUF1772 domain-containing protein n=1 Tax=Solicola gregarius TaxID=2908642 RepID=A0AA46YN62_9ACTN|nr:anthrone oxygenase family protein [Solicola gregarius]UYM06418.1 DUF1772 domain-containing protein [Solicola gregarius]